MQYHVTRTLPPFSFLAQKCTPHYYTHTKQSHSPIWPYRQKQTAWPSTRTTLTHRHPSTSIHYNITNPNNRPQTLPFSSFCSHFSRICVVYRFLSKILTFNFCIKLWKPFKLDLPLKIVRSLVGKNRKVRTLWAINLHHRSLEVD